jgi:hypothetical protein
MVVDEPMPKKQANLWCVLVDWYIGSLVIANVSENIYISVFSLLVR